MGSKVSVALRIVLKAFVYLLMILLIIIFSGGDATFIYEGF